MQRVRTWLAIAAAIPCAFAFCGGLSLLAQQPGSIYGTVTDAHGSTLVDAKVTLTGADTGLHETRVTGKSGNYSFGPLATGNYSLEVFAIGFQKYVQTQILLGPNQTFVSNPKLSIGSIEPHPLSQQQPGQIELEPAALLLSVRGSAISPDSPAAVPLFRDPIHDGAADPVVVWNRARKTWWMLYTNRRADIEDTTGVRWVHGTRIGIAESSDGGAHWKYVGEADIPFPKPDYTLWAPEVIDVDGIYYMFLTEVPGTFSDWNAERHIVHFTSPDLLHWKQLDTLQLASDRTIDACVFRLPDGNWRLWYKNERDGSKIYYSDSPDLVHWTAKGIAVKTRGEGPVVFQWHGAYWLINDSWAGLGAFRSTDLTTWQRQPDNLLKEPGTQPTDRAMGNHPDVVVDGSGRAWLFYFTSQTGEDAKPGDPNWKRRSVLHVTELHEKNGVLTVDRNALASIHMLPPPKNKKSDLAAAW
jgi:hypothetical protein